MAVIRWGQNGQIGVVFVAPHGHGFAAIDGVGGDFYEGSEFTLWVLGVWVIVLRH